MTYSPEEKNVWVRALCARMTTISQITFEQIVADADAALAAFQAKFGKGEETEIKWDENADAFVDRKIGTVEIGSHPHFNSDEPEPHPLYECDECGRTGTTIWPICPFCKSNQAHKPEKE